MGGETLIEPKKTRIVLSIYHLVVVSGVVASGAVAWAAFASHVGASGHPELTERVDGLEGTLVRVEEAQKTAAQVTAVKMDYQQAAIDRVSDKIDKLTDLTAGVVASQTEAAQIRSRARADIVRENLRLGRDPLHGL